MKALLSYLWLKAPWSLVYMLQQVEYNPWKFVAWLKPIPDLGKIKRRGELVITNRVRLMLFISYGSWLLVLILVIYLFSSIHSALVLALVVLMPLASILSLFITTLALQKLVVNPTQAKEISAAKRKLETMQAVKIAVLGSYGKTTMKELLVTILGEGKRVAATPGNKNVLISHARWVTKHLKGDEEVVIFEYGESKPGDISVLGQFSEPNVAVITGLAPAHLDGYPSLHAIAQDLATIGQFTDPGAIYINAQAESLHSLVKGNYYDTKGIGDWTVSDVAISLEGTTFTLNKKGEKLELYSGLLGEHQIGPICAAVAIAKNLGIDDEDIIRGVAATKPYQHRMQPRHLHGAWLIDDTYNGNIEGMRAGLRLLKALPGKRKIYVTPGLVDQGEQTQAVHETLGTLIAEAQPDRTVLMKNSVTTFIKSGLEKGGYRGEVVIEPDPLDYYGNLEHFLAAGDIVLLQNDWPDSYS